MLKSFSEGNIVGGVTSLIDTLSDERVFDCLDAAFRSAFPEVLPTNVRPTDVFALEDVLRALAPFIVRMVRRVGEGLRPAKAMQTTKAAT
jgi:hypothetical protein